MSHQQRTTVAFLLPLAAAGSYFASIPWAGMILCVAGMWLAAFAIIKLTGPPQFAAFYFNGLMLAALLYFAPGGNAFFAVSVLLVPPGITGRLLLIRFMSETRYNWYELLFMIAAAGCWVTGTILAVTDFSLNSLAPILSPLLPLMGLFLKTSDHLFQELAQLRVTRSGYGVALGSTAPDFALADENNNMTRLSEYKGVRDLLLIFIRGDWCPVCQMMLRTYLKNARKFREKNIMLMAIGPDPVGVNKKLVERLELDFKMLSDEGHHVSKKYGVQIPPEKNNIMPEKSDGLPLPASFLVDRNGIVRYSSRPDRVGEFLDPALIFPVIESLPSLQEASS